MHTQPHTIPLGLIPPWPPAVERPGQPRHLGIVVSGHRRWARLQGLPSETAMAMGLQRAIEAVDCCIHRRIPQLTLYVFTSDMLAALGSGAPGVLAVFLNHLQGLVTSLQGRGVRLRIAGDMEPMNEHLRQLILDAEMCLAGNTELALTISIDGVRDWDLSKAFKHWQANTPAHSVLPLETEALQPYVMQAQRPDPNLVIRTGGPIPRDNAMVWHTEETALYFTHVLWPDFGSNALAKALRWFSQDNRPAGIEIRPQR
jgi:undecaprenyl diphosphate synthase